jgi:hypothetical protein
VPALRPSAEASESRPDWRGWHSLRRFVAPGLHDLGVDDLTVQKIMRHSSLTVTQRCHIKTLPEQTVSAMAKLENKLSTMIQ